jgi:phage terminase large subunit-like protein
MAESLVHGEGDRFGEPFEPTGPQCRFLDRLYRYDPTTRRLVVRRALLGRAKGWGKTEFFAAIALERFAGPLAPASPNIPIAAASFEQADLLYGSARTMAEEGPLRPFVEAFDTEMQFRDGSPGRLFRVAAAAGTNDGGRPTAFLCDELHEWTGNKARVHIVIGNSLRKRTGGLELNITTAGSDLDSLLGRLYLLGRALESGEAPADPSFLFDWLEAGDGHDLTDPAQLRAAVLEANEHADLFGITDGLVSRYYEIPEFEYRRYHLNQWTRADDSWLPRGAWSACEVDAVEFDPAAALFAGVDVALKHDSTAVVVVGRTVEGRLGVGSKVWTTDGGRIDVAAVENHLRDLHRRHRSVEFAYDPAYFERSAQALEDEGLRMVEFPQRPARMVPACHAAYEAIVSGELAHDGDPVLADHVLSAAVRDTDGGWSLSKGRSRRHIDACIALVIALHRAVQRPEPEVVPAFFSLADLGDDE